MVKIGLIIIATSVVVGSLFLTWNSYVESRAAEQKRQAMMMPKEDVVHAARDIKNGDLIAAKDVELKQIPVSDREVAHNDLLAPRHVDHYVKRIDRAVGHRTNCSISKGQLVLLQYLQ